MKRLNIFVDETGEFGFGKGSSELYGVSFTFHNQDDDILFELNKLNYRLAKIGYTGMIHMADLIAKRGDYSRFSIVTRKRIFKALFHFSRRINAKYYTIIVNKKYIENIVTLKSQLLNKINKMINEHEKYFNKFDKIIMYYDNGQEMLATILKSAFLWYDSFEHRVQFDHQQKRLFQVSDMLTSIDKLDYKYKNKMSFAKSEKYFFTDDEIRKILQELNKKRM